jgi:hypothetical protein
MSTFTNIDKPLVGGIDSADFVAVEAIDTFPPDYEHDVDASGLTLKAGFAWINLPAVSGTLAYTEREEYSAQGLRYAKELRALLPHDDSANRALLQQFLFGRFVVRYKDHTGNWKLTGSPKEPLRLRSSFETSEFAGQIGYRLNFTGRHGHYARYLFNAPLGSIFINSDGQIEISSELQGIISLDAQGRLVASGADANRYSLDSQGRLVYT